MAIPPSPPLARDFSARSFEGVIVPLFILFRANLEMGGGMVIKDRTFKNCVIEGPTVLLPVGGVDFDNCDLGYAGGDMRNLLLHPFSPDKVVGAIAMANCKFIGCRFFSIGFTGAEDFLKNMMKVGVGAP